MTNIKINVTGIGLKRLEDIEILIKGTKEAIEEMPTKEVVSKVSEEDKLKERTSCNK